MQRTRYEVKVRPMSSLRDKENDRWMARSLVDDDSDMEQKLAFLRAHPSAALPPSPFAPESLGRPRAPTPSASLPDEMSSYVLDSPSSLSSRSSPPMNHAPLFRSPSDGESSFLPDYSPAHSFARPPKSMGLSDPSHFPDPYLFRPPHHHLTSNSTPPALSSRGSSSASTRSSAYTSSGSGLVSGDYENEVIVASGDDEEVNVGVGITSDEVVHLLAGDGNVSIPSQSRIPIDQARWSESYSSSVRSRSSSVAFGLSNSVGDIGAPGLDHKPSFDIGWQTVEERDEEVLISDDETDDYHNLPEVDGDEEEEEEERTAAAVIAEEGRGMIVKGDGIPISEIQIEPGTTHLLVGSSSTPNSVPSFLTNSIPAISTTLLALDVSANFLGALPPCLAGCSNLEELNIASNPLRVLPVFLCHLTTLRVLITDATGISILPDSLSQLDKLHTLSFRRNKLHSLPSWLCLLPSLQTVCLDGNPFQGPWKALVEPLLAKVPTTPTYPPFAPSMTLPGLTGPAETEEDLSDNEDSPDPSSAEASGKFLQYPEEEVTITPDRPLGRPPSSPSPAAFSEPSMSGARGLARNRTTPTRAYHDQPRAKSSFTPDDNNHFPTVKGQVHDNSGHFGSLEMRRMRSAGDLRKRLQPELHSSKSTPVTPALEHRPVSSSKILDAGSLTPERPSIGRFGSLGANTGLGSPSRSANGSRSVLNASLWDNVLDGEDNASQTTTESISLSQRKSPPKPLVEPSRQINRGRGYTEGEHTLRLRQDSKEGKDKSGRWGFLKKMSMGKMRIDTPPTTSPRSANSQGRVTKSPQSPAATAVVSGSASVSERVTASIGPQIDLRFSTSGLLDSLSYPTPSRSASPTPQTEKRASTDAMKSPPVAFSSTYLLPQGASRTTRRRSFLPIDSSQPLLSAPISESDSFISDMTGSSDADETTKPTPAIDYAEQLARREEDKARESYTRALRSVMAYLRDMNDLGSSQSNQPISMYSSPSEEHLMTSRSRWPTTSEARAHSEISMSGQLRSIDAMASLRGSSTQTLSVATNDSTGSEERKFKDDRGKRAMVVREIVETERTYVKGLQELVDIYIRPGSVPVNTLTSGSGKDTVVPTSERKIVFSGVDALFSFHKESFLPALEVAAAPLMKPAATLQEADADGQLSLRVAKAVGSMFLKHAAFMKMYSAYINNFDTSVQRVRLWSADRTTTGTSTPSSTISPSSSSAQLVGLGLTLSALAPSSTPETSLSNGAVALTTGQRKRIRAYLKRCRMSPRHSQLNLEGYLLLPVQRIPRYRLLLEELLSSTPPTYEYMNDPLDQALTEISSLANNMNEGKRESESRRKLVQWQSRIRGRFPSPLVQPHRRLIMDGPLLLTRVVRKALVAFETFNAQGDSSTVQVDCLAPELTPRPLIGVLCNDLLVLCRDPSDGQDPTGYVDLWAVLRMQTLPQPASIVHGNALRLVDNKAILYFDAPSSSDALNWFRAINLHIPASKS